MRLNLSLFLLQNGNNKKLPTSIQPKAKVLTGQGPHRQNHTGTQLLPCSPHPSLPSQFHNHIAVQRARQVGTTGVHLLPAAVDLVLHRAHDSVIREPHDFPAGDLHSNARQSRVGHRPGVVNAPERDCLGITSGNKRHLRASKRKNRT